MADFVDHPAVLFVVLLVLLIGAVAFGAFVLRRIVTLKDDGERDDFSLVQSSTLILLALLIGFSMSMAVNRYDQRKNLEEEEANAVGTEYAQADLADAPLNVSMQADLVRYVKLRLADYRTRDPRELAHINKDTAELQSQLWKLSTQVAAAKPTPISAVIVTGMNDVLDSQDYSETARINRIPIGTWVLMITIAVLVVSYRVALLQKAIAAGGDVYTQRSWGCLC